MVALKPPNAPTVSLAPLLQLLPQPFHPYVPDVLAAAQRYNVPPSVLFGVLGVESGFGTDPGTFSGSIAGAQGVSQFMPGTAAGIRGPGVRHGVNVADTPKAIRTQIFGAANYLTQLGVQKNIPLALAHYNAGPAAPASAAGSYPQDVLAIAKQFSVADKIAQAGGAKGGGAPYVDPFGKGISIGRTDMGIDPYPSGGGSTVIRAIGRSKYLGMGGSGWPAEGGTTGGQGPVYKLLRGPQKGSRIYTYEGITPAAGLQPGEILKKGQPIAKATGQDFETGFALGRGAGFQPTATGPGQPPLPADHANTPEGMRFAKFVSSIQAGGAPLGIGASFGGGNPILGLTSGSPAASVAASTGASPLQAQAAVQSAREQNQASPSLIALTPPTAPQVPFPEALARLFGGALPQLGGGVAGGSGLSTTDLATILAQLGAAQNPLQTLSSATSRRRRKGY